MLTVIVHEGAECAELYVQGDMVLGAPLDRLSETVGGLRQRCVALDLNEVGRVDASGLGVLAAIHAGLAAEGRELLIVSPRPELRYLLALCGLDSAFTIAFPSAAHAGVA
jgi:anti-anti-sigma factor